MRGGFRFSGRPGLSLGPLEGVDGLVVEVVDGWVGGSGGWVELRGEYGVGVGFVGSRAAGEELCGAIVRGALAYGFDAWVEGVEVVDLSGVRGGWGGVSFRIHTPAQFRVSTGLGSLLATSPSPGLLLRSALKLLYGREVAGLLDRWVVQVRGGFREATMFLGDRPVWGVVGSGLLVPLRGAPDLVLEALYRAGVASGFLGVGKSLLSGLGVSEFRVGVFP